MIYISLADYSFMELVTIIKEHPHAEIRLDRLELSDDQVEQIFRLSPHLIATCRPGNMRDDERLRRLQNAIVAGAALVDIELDAPEWYQQKLIAAVRSAESRFIISYHNFTTTPALPRLRRIVRHCEALQPDYIKVVTFCRQPADTRRLLDLYTFTNRPLIAFGMGPAGQNSRVAALRAGAPFVFAALDRQHLTAPGQLTLEELEQLLRSTKQDD